MQKSLIFIKYKIMHKVKYSNSLKDFTDIVLILRQEESKISTYKRSR